MFDKVLIANRGDQLSVDSAAAQPESLQVADLAGDLAAEVHHVR